VTSPDSRRTVSLGTISSYNRRHPNCGQASTPADERVDREITGSIYNDDNALSPAGAAQFVQFAGHLTHARFHTISSKHQCDECACGFLSD
jgi:hypothetical protein